MIQFPHESFLKDNDIQVGTLPNELQKRIRGFDELREDLEYTTDEDRPGLLSKMERLSHELDEDLEEYYQDRLGHNEEEEDNDEEKEEDQAPKHEQMVLGQEPPTEAADTETKEAPPAELPQEDTPPYPGTQQPGDEEILEGFYHHRQTIIHPSELKAKGYTGQISGRRITVGRFCLRKGRYETCYKLLLGGE
jgi:hypothetical protein